MAKPKSTLKASIPKKMNPPSGEFNFLKSAKQIAETRRLVGNPKSKISEVYSQLIKAFE
jgi:hypothetical protein